MFYISNQYYTKPTYDINTKTNYHVRLEDSKFKRKLIFNQYNKLFEIKYEFWLEGDYQIPNELLTMSISSEFAQINNLSVIEEKRIQKYHKYVATVTFNNNNSQYFDGDIFNKTTTFIAKLDINKEVFNKENLSSQFNTFANQMKRINFRDEINYSNYFPINKLSEYYISSKYRDSYSTLTFLPDDFFDWQESKRNNICPLYYFIQASNFKNKSYEAINNIYQINLKSPTFSKSFDKVDINLKYYIDNQLKTLSINPDQTNINIENSNILALNAKTLYDYKKQELQINENGIDGVYFPIPTNGSIQISLWKNNIAYKDEIEFSFDNNFYSSSNSNLNIEMKEFIDVKGEWKEIIYV